MAGEENLRPVRTEEEAREKGRAGGIASGEARRQKRDLKRAFEALLEADHNVKDKSTGDIVTMSGADALALAMFQKGLKGNTRAFEMVRDTSGQKPIEKVMVTEVDQDTIDEVERMVLGDD